MESQDKGTGDGGDCNCCDPVFVFVSTILCCCCDFFFSRKKIFLFLFLELSFRTIVLVVGLVGLDNEGIVVVVVAVVTSAVAVVGGSSFFFVFVFNLKKKNIFFV